MPRKFWQPMVLLGGLTFATPALAQSDRPKINSWQFLDPNRSALAVPYAGFVTSLSLPSAPSPAITALPPQSSPAFVDVGSPLHVFQVADSQGSAPTPSTTVPATTTKIDARSPSVDPPSQPGKAADLDHLEAVTSRARTPILPQLALDPTHTIQAFPTSFKLPSQQLTQPKESGQAIVENTEHENPDAKSVSPQLPYADPDLGIILLREIQFSPCPNHQTFDPDLGCIAIHPPCENGQPFDPDLGCPSFRPPQGLPASRAPIAYLLPRLDYFNSSNVFSQRLNTVQDSLVRPGLMLLFVPPLGRTTYLIASIEGNFVRYNNLSEIDYNELKFRVGIFQQLSSKTSIELSWTNQQLFLQQDQVFRLPGLRIPGLDKGTRFFNEHSLQLSLSRRDQLAKRLSLNTFYQLRIALTDPIVQASVITTSPPNQSRVTNAFLASLNYDLQPSVLQLGIDYQFSIAKFTRQSREDAYHQIIARLSYTLFRNTQLTGFVGYSFGRSSDPNINFNSLLLGISMTVNLVLF